jgi:SAM-dependent methyltransferase
MTRPVEQLETSLCSVLGGVDTLGDAVPTSTGGIRYRTNWLAQYEFDLDAEDEALKQVEAQWVAETLRVGGRWGRIASLLDVGTCTGRYPLLLREAVCPEGSIVGVDNDPACVDFARAKVVRAAKDDTRIALVRADFTASDLILTQTPFDLITCMMSTLSHFGHGRAPGFDDALQAVLLRFAHLLAPGGLLLFSVWSRKALDSGHLLAIYDESDRLKLTAWTPDAEEVDRRLMTAGFGVRECSGPDPRLDLWACEKAST